MRKINLVIGTYNSIPINFQDAEHIYQKHCRPFLQLVNKYPEVSFTSYFSGFFYDWLESKHPELLMLINDLVRDGHFELLGGAYYEPVFSIIPSKDRGAQIEEMTTFLRKRFSKRARGFWLAEQVWEPNFPSILSTSGFDYSFLDKSFFINAGCSKDDLFQPYVTEDQGKTISVFPVHNRLLKDLSQMSAGAAVEKLLSYGDASGDKVICIMLNGEDFESQKIKNKITFSWFENFLEELKKKRKQIKTVMPSRFIRKFSFNSKIYIPCLNYRDVKKRAVVYSPDKVKKRFDILNSNGNNDESGAGFFRDYLSDYIESNKIYSKMMYVNVLINQVRSDRSRKKSSREELWKGQHNSAYWPGRKTGIENCDIRTKTYNALIEAEKLSREKGVFDTSLVKTDFDMDGLQECLYQGQVINAYVHSLGACLFELDNLTRPWNYINTFKQKTPGQKNGNGEYCFLDHVLTKDEDIDSFSKYEHSELADFHMSEYKIRTFDKEHHEILFSIDGVVKKKNQTWNVIIEKKYKFMKRGIAVNYEIFNLSDKILDVCFSVEFNLNLEIYKNRLEMNISSPKKDINMIGKNNEIKNVSEIRINHHQKKNTIAIQSQEKINLWSIPRYHNSLYQYSRFLFCSDIAIDKKTSWKNRITFRLERIKTK